MPKTGEGLAASPLLGRSVELKISSALIDLAGGKVATSLPPMRRQTTRLFPSAGG